MIFSRYKKEAYSSLGILIAILCGISLTMLIPGCAADDFDSLHATDRQYGEDAQVILELAIPQGEMIKASTRAVDSRPEKNELAINSLRLLIFPKEGGKATVNCPLLIPSEMPVSPNKSATYEVGGLKAGNDYHMYIIGNMGEAVTFEDNPEDATESNLRKVIMDYTSQMPHPGNLPMVYESDEVITAPAPGATPLHKSVALKYACVKVRLNLIFDKSANNNAKTNYGEQGFVPRTMKLTNVTAKAPLLIESHDTNVDQKDKIEGSKEIDLTVAGSFYDSWESGDGDNDTKEMITVTGEPSTAPASYAGKWLSRHTIYLPERYDAESQLTFILEGVLADKENTVMESSKVKFEPLKIGVKDEDYGVAATELPRGSFYEVIASVENKEVEGNPMEATIIRSEWKDTTIPVDFLHTYLQVSKTAASVRSLDEDYIVYQTDGTDGVRFICDDDEASTLDGKAAVIGVPKYSTERGHHMEFRVNPAIDITNVTLNEDGEISGTATGYMIAGNIKKRISVDYNMTPFFEIEPSERTIAYAADGENATTFHYRTNLNGIVVADSENHNLILLDKDHTSGTLGTLTIQMQEGGSPSDSEGDILVITSAVETTTSYEMFARPFSGAAGKNAEEYGSNITVIVQPAISSYRINFRAINDYQVTNSTISETTNLFIKEDGTLKPLTIGYAEEFLASNGYKLPNEANTSHKWIDFWTNTNTTIASEDHHKIYIYNQVGNNTDFGTISKNVCYFTQWSDASNSMTADGSNPGWYYFDLSKTDEGKWDDAADKEGIGAKDLAYYSIPRPNETLMIFHSAEASAGNIMVHRLAHDKEPGVPLGAFADGEGWTLYDPTRDPRYTTYDSKPVIEDVAYTIYSDKPLLQWYTYYGAWDGTRANKIKLYADRWLPNGASNNEVTFDGKTYVQNQQVTVSGRTYYKNVLWFKAPRGEYDKNILLKFNVITGTTIINHKVFLEYNFDDNWTDGSGAVAHFVNSDGTSIACTMNWYEDVKDGDNKKGLRYSVAVPNGYNNSKVYFTNNNDGVRYPATGYCTITQSHNYLFWTSSTEYGDWNYNQAPGNPGTADLLLETPLFNGDVYSPKNGTGSTRVIEGYYNSTTNRWSPTPF